MKTLVTGASGFLGGHLVERCLRAGDSVRALVRPSSDLSHLRSLRGVELVHGDLDDAPSLLQAVRGVEVVHHAAARVTDYGSRQQFQAANVDGTRRLLDAARAAGVRRFVFVSSPSVVADGRAQVDIDESHPFPRRFINLYSETKAAAERLVLQANRPDFVTCAIRARGIWGPRDKQGFLPRITARLMTGRFPDLSGGERVLASICHCDNAAEACALAARAPAVGGRVYFVTDGEQTDVWEFAREVVALFSLPPIRRKVDPALLGPVAAAVELLWKLPALGHHRPPPLSRHGLAMLTQTATYDIRAAQRDLGYRPLIDRAEGLRRLKAWVDAIGGVSRYVEAVR